MPSNLLTADTTFPTLTQEQSTDEKFEKITSYLYMLLEQLRYSMGNLDKENFNDAGLEEIANIITEPVYVQLKDDEANIAALTVTAAGLGARLSDAEGNITQLNATTTSLTSRISSAEGSISTLQQTATSLTSRISDAEGNISSLTQTVKSVVYRESSSRLRGLPEAKIRFMIPSHFPVEPKPPSPRWVSPSSSAGTKAAVYTGAMHSWATRSPG